MKTPLIGICRHRLTTDGQGVTTLVAFHGCPLCCRYCLNEQCLRADGVWQQMDAQQILDEVMIDDLYFKATNGGVTFGGGEPLLRSDEIVTFCQLRPSDWHIAIETSLTTLHDLLEFSDDMNSSTLECLMASTMTFLNEMPLNIPSTSIQHL